MTNELIELVDHLNNITSDILLRYHTGIELTDLQEDVLRDLFKCEQERYLISLEDIPHTTNNFINQIIMGRTQGSKNKSKINLINKNMGKLDLNADVIGLNGLAVKADGDNNLSIKQAFKFAVLNSKKDKETPEKTYEAYKLAMKIEAEESELTIDDLKSIKDSVGETFMKDPVILGFLWDFINNK